MLMLCIFYIAVNGKLREEHKTHGDNVSGYQGRHVRRQGKTFIFILFFIFFLFSFFVYFFSYIIYLFIFLFVKCRGQNSA